MKLVSFLLFFLLCGGLVAQPISKPEPLLVALNQPFVASGETLYFQVLNATPSEPFRSRVGHADLVDAQGQALVSTHFALGQNGGHGQIAIPPGLPEKVYFLRFYTRWNLAFGVQAVPYLPLPVYNAFEGELGELVSLASQPIAATDSRVRTQPERDQLGEKAQSEAQIDWNTAQSGLACATVVYASLAFDGQGQSLADQLPRWAQSFSLAAGGEVPTPETDLQIQFWNGDGGGNLTSPLLKLYQPQTGVFHDADCIEGNIRVEFTPFEGKRTVQLLSFHPGLSRYPMPSKQLPPFVPVPQGLPTDAPERTAAVRSYLQTIRLQRQLDEVYQLLPKVAPAAAAPVARPNADRVYMMKDYQLINNFEDFLTRVLSQTALEKKSDGSVKLRLNHPETYEKLPEEPWIMVNGFFIHHLPDALSLPISQVEQIDYYYKRSTILREFVFPMTRGLVLGIWLKPGAIEPESLRNNSFTYVVSGLDPLPPLEASIDHVDAPHLPDFRQALAWWPNLTPQTRRIGYAVGSLRGNYCIRTRGITPDGEIWENIASFQVIGR